MNNHQQTRTCGYWRMLYAAFYANWCYVDVAKRWRGFGFLYLLFMIMILSIPFSARTVIEVLHYMDEVDPFQHDPAIYVVDGHWATDEKLPFLLKNPSGSVVGLLDKESDATKMKLKYPELRFLMTRDHLTSWLPDMRLFFMTKALSFNKQPQQYKLGLLNKNDVLSVQDVIKTKSAPGRKKVAAFIIYTTVASTVFCLSAINTILSGILGQAISIIFFHMRLSFLTSCRLMTAAATVPLSLGCVLAAINIYFNPITYGALLAVYFSYATISVRRARSWVALHR